MYRAIGSLRELLFVAQDRLRVELQRRRPDGREGAIELVSIVYTLRRGALYEGVVGGIG